MAFTPTPNVARVAIESILLGQLCVNTLWFENPGAVPYDAGTLTNLIGGVDTWWQTNVLPLLASDYVMNTISAIAQDALDAPAVTLPVSGAGSALTGSLPGNVCLTVKFNTQFRGRSGRGRNYVSGIPEAGVVGNAVTQTFNDDLLAAYDTIPTTINEGTHVVVSFFLDGVARPQGFVQPVISYNIVDRAVDSQRRRLIGRGA